jgi:hypothetical protein
MQEMTRKDVSEFVGQTVVDTFNVMFGDNVIDRAAMAMPINRSDANYILASVRLSQGDADVDFCFNFNRDLLLIILARIYSREVLSGDFVFEDLASEIVNIVCSKVKAYMNERGYDMKMDFPVIEKSEHIFMKGNDNIVHLYFNYKADVNESDIGIEVGFQINDRKAA